MIYVRGRDNPLCARESARVLLLGDSIRLGHPAGPGYQPYVQEALADRAQVLGPEDNCGDSAHVLAHLDGWLGDGPWHVIHFNCGLHDLRSDRSTCIPRTPIGRYRDNLRAICARLQRTSADLIWASTTPVIYERHLTKSFDRREEDVLVYNQVALEVVTEHGLQVNDLHALALDAGAEGILSKDGVHFTEVGSHLLAASVAAKIRTCLEHSGR